jgi:hypothetical protein
MEKISIPKEARPLSQAEYGPSYPLMSDFFSIILRNTSSDPS